MSFRPRRAAATAINTPTAVHILGSKTVNQEEAEKLLTQFVDASETIATTIPGQTEANEILKADTGLSNSTGNAAVISQLKRLQRDLRGLPPLLDTTEKRRLDDKPDERPNKKVKFDSEDEEKESEKEESEKEESEKEESEKEESEKEESEKEESEKEEEEAPEEKKEEEKKEKHKSKKDKKDKKHKDKKEKKDKKDKKKHKD